MTLSTSKKQIGQDAENRALIYLEQQGLTLVARNYCCRGGEIDLIMRDHNSLVFVEVRYRANPHFGGALASVDHRKQMKLIHCAEHYIAHNQVSEATRFDVVALSHENTALEIQWVKDAFQTH